jgi:hypothetical protein
MWCSYRFVARVDQEALMREKEEHLLAAVATSEISDKLREAYEWKERYGYWITPCANCKNEVGTIHVEYYRCATLIYVLSHVRISARLCVICNLWEYLFNTGYTLLLGWWGPFGLLYTLYILPLNTATLFLSMYRWLRR